jgi:hypothetical protein
MSAVSLAPHRAGGALLKAASRQHGPPLCTRVYGWVFSLEDHLNVYDRLGYRLDDPSA